MGLNDVLPDLESIDYAAWAVVMPACAVGALYIRERVWVVANANGRDDKSSQIERPGIQGETGREGADGDTCSTSWGLHGGQKLNPEFALWLMGYPTGWLDTAPQETPLE